MHRLADAQKDTANLMEALVRLNRMKKVEPQYRFQLAELDYVRSGNIQGIEALVKKNPDYRRGKVILVKAYYRKGALAKMVPYTAFLAQEAKGDKELSEPLGDLWAFQKKKEKANEAYFDAVRMDKKDRGLFDKVYKYAKETGSDYRAALLKQGYESFPEDLGLKYDYAMTQGKTQKALDLFKEILLQGPQQRARPAERGRNRRRPAQDRRGARAPAALGRPGRRRHAPLDPAGRPLHPDPERRQAGRRARAPVRPATQERRPRLPGRHGQQEGRGTRTSPWSS